MGNLGYLTKEGFRNLRVNKLMTVASITVLFSCLMLVGIAFMMLVNIETFIAGIESENVIMVYVDDETDSYDYIRLGNELRAINNVASVDMVEKDAAYAEILAGLDDGLRNYLQSTDENPLPDAYKVTVADMDGFENVVSAFFFQGMDFFLYFLKQTVFHITDIDDHIDLVTTIFQCLTYFCHLCFCHAVA